MKQMVICLCEVVASAVVFFFCINMVFQPSGDSVIWKNLGQAVERFQEHQIRSDSFQKLKGIMNTPAPDIKLKNTRYKIGEELDLPSIVFVKDSENNIWKPVKEQQDVAVELAAVIGRNGNVVQMDERCFSQSGCYSLKVRAIGRNGRSRIMSFRILVE